jgi:hypothetical protein
VVKGYKGASGKVVLNWEDALPVAKKSTTKPSNMAEMFEGPHTSPSTIANVVLIAGEDFVDYYAKNEKPVTLFASDFKGFRRGIVDLELYGPKDFRTWNWQTRQGYLHFVMPLSSPPGWYRLTATQGNLKAYYTFPVKEARGPNGAVDPYVQLGQKFKIYLAGFPPNTWIPIHVYQMVTCPPGEGKHTCYRYYWSFRGKTNSLGYGTFRLTFYKEKGTYTICAKPPNMDEVNIGRVVIRD